MASAVGSKEDEGEAARRRGTELGEKAGGATAREEKGEAARREREGRREGGT